MLVVLPRLRGVVRHDPQHELEKGRDRSCEFGALRFTMPQPLAQRRPRIM